jgi:DNA-directed RNA polymerase specialized sigma24 family protein
MEQAVVRVADEAHAGTDDGFGAFVAARGDALWRSAWLLTGDHQLAEDLVQTALAKSWRASRRT